MSFFTNFITKLKSLKKVWISIFTLIIFFGAVKLFSFSSDTNRNNIIDDKYRDSFYKNYKVFSIVIPENLTFAGEVVPTEKFDVRERLDRELLVNTYWQSATMLNIKRANRWFPVITPILKQYNIPEDFKYLALIESSFTNVVSPAGASGYWQIMKETAKRYDLEISEEVDERYNVEKATVLACKYLRECYNATKSWTLSAAAYNMGLGGIKKSQDEQKVQSYYDLYLNEETSRYMFRILAMKTIVENPMQYGFYLRKRDMYPPIPTYTLQVDSSITSLANFAIAQKTTYKMLKYFNPWLRKNKLTNQNKNKYTITLPKPGHDQYETLLSQWMESDMNKLVDSTHFIE